MYTVIDGVFCKEDPYKKMNTMKKLLNTALLLFAVLMTSCTAPNAWSHTHSVVYIVVDVGTETHTECQLLVSQRCAQAHE